MFKNIRNKNFIDLLVNNKIISRNLMNPLGWIALINIPTTLKILSISVGADPTVRQTIDLFMHSHPILLSLQIGGNMLVYFLIIVNLIKLYSSDYNKTINPKDISLLMEGAFATNENKKDNSFLFHKIHNQTQLEKSKE